MYLKYQKVIKVKLPNKIYSFSESDMMWIYQIKQFLTSNSYSPKTLFYLLHREKGIELVSFLQALDEQLRLKKWCKAISLLPSNLHYATSLQALKSLSITCKRWSIVSCVHDSLLGSSSKRRERLSMKCVATNHSSF